MRLRPAALALLVLLPALANCGKGASSSGESTEKTPTDTTRAAIAGVVVAPVVTGNFTESVEAFGTIVASPGHTATGAAPGPTRVTKVFVTVGQSVKAGELLVAFEQTAFNAAVETAQAALKAAEQAAARAERLVEAGVSPRRDVESSQAELAAARAGMTNATRARELAELHAPISGVITRMGAVIGASVDAGQSLVEITDPSSPNVLLAVSPTDAGKLRVGAVCTLGTSADVETTRVADGRVVDVGAVVDSGTRTVSVRATLSGSHRTLRMGESVFARIAVAEHPKAVIIPTAALVPAGEGYRVFVVDGVGVAHARDVKVGGRSDRGAWITEGLAAGDRVVTVGAFGVDDSVKVAPGKP